MLTQDGFIAVADLETEDGTFHSDNTGVHHFGFSQEELFDTVAKIGYKEYSYLPVHAIKKEKKEYPVFLLIARK
jgi:hypothetical protein